MFTIDLYRSKGQIDWNVVGPILTDDHYYKYCSTMEEPTLPGYPCLAGSYSLAGDSLSPCEICPALTFSDTEGANSCTPCPQSSYNPDDGVDRLRHDNIKDCLPKQCPPGRFLNDVDNVGNNNLGTFSLSDCVACPRGKFKNALHDHTATSCFECPIGSYSRIEGSVTCNLCPLGSYVNITGKSECSKCASGRYNANVEGSGSEEDCKPCAR